MNQRPNPEIPKKHIFIAGEGNNDIGCYATEKVYRTNKFPGVLEILLEKIKNSGWEIIDGIKWQNIRKLVVGEHGEADTINVRRACQRAKEMKCEVFAFSRDRDDDKNRIQQINAGITESKDLYPSVNIIGGCAVKTIEAWVLAFSGELHTEECSKPKLVSLLQQKNGIDPKNTEQMVEFVQKHNLDEIAKDAQSLQEWLKLAKDVL